MFENAKKKLTINPTVRKKIKRIIYLAVGILILVFAFIIYWNYFFTYSDGYRSGLLQKFSRKGTIFKTYEGEMILSSVATTANTAISSEKFLFSVTDKKTVAKLDSLQGQYVTVKYNQKNSTLWWRGESVYIVESVELKK
jgi:hypothetical protein